MCCVKLYPIGILKVALAFATRNFSVNAKASNVVGHLCHCVKISDVNHGWMHTSSQTRIPQMSIWHTQINWDRAIC